MTAIVLVPGLVCTAELFAAQLPALWTRGPVTVASTLGGDSMAAIAADILAQAPPRFALAGLSMGGYVAFEILRMAPERVERLALLDTSPRPDAPEQSERRRGLMARLDVEAFEAVIEPVLRGLPAPARREDETLFQTNLRMAQAVGPDGFRRQTRAIIGRADSRPDLAGISIPTLVLVGDQDAVTPPEIAREMADAIPRARLSVIPDSGHVSTLEQPAAVSAALLDWLNA
jgi:pimeloyl-ACP methyl ester carboxylesterase